MNDHDLRQPEPAALQNILEDVGSAQSIRRGLAAHRLGHRLDELLRRSGLRNREGRAVYLDIHFGDWGESSSTAVYCVWVRRGPILAVDRRKDSTNVKRYRLFVVSPPTSDVKFFGDAPSTGDGSTIDVTDEPGPWWPALLQEIPKIRRGLTELQDAVDEAVREHEESTNRQYAEYHRQRLAAAHAIFAEPKKTGCAVILALTLAAFASATLSLSR